jgi:hypothetical protein
VRKKEVQSIPVGASKCGPYFIFLVKVSGSIPTRTVIIINITIIIIISIVITISIIIIPIIIIITNMIIIIITISISTISSFSTTAQHACSITTGELQERDVHEASQQENQKRRTSQEWDMRAASQ